MVDFLGGDDVVDDDDTVPVAPIQANPYSRLPILDQSCQIMAPVTKKVNITDTITSAKENKFLKF